MSKELDELIAGQGDDGQDHGSMLREVATEYADSDEVKRRHYMEFIQAASDHAEKHRGCAHIWELDGNPYFHGTCKMHSMEAKGMDGICKLLGL